MALFRAAGSLDFDMVLVEGRDPLAAAENLNLARVYKEKVYS